MVKSLEEKYPRAAVNEIVQRDGEIARQGIKIQRLEKEIDQLNKLLKKEKKNSYLLGAEAVRLRRVYAEYEDEVDELKNKLAEEQRKNRNMKLWIKCKGLRDYTEAVEV